MKKIIKLLMVVIAICCSSGIYARISNDSFSLTGMINSKEMKIKKEQFHELISYYKFQGYPQFFLLGRDGKIFKEDLPFPLLNKEDGENNSNTPSISKFKMIREGLAQTTDTGK